MRIIILTLLCVHLLSAGYAQRHYFNHFGVDEGLSNNAILCSVQDKDGFIWFGTKDGLNRFDGYNFKQYYSDSQTDNGLGSNFIHTLFVDRDRKIWIGTDQGIFIFDPFTERFLSFQGETKGEVLMIKDDQAGNIWYISDNKLFNYNPVTRQKTQIDKHLGSSVTAFTIDQQNHVWMAYHQTIKNVTTGHTVSIPQGGREGYRVEKLAMDDRGTLWIGTARDGVFTLSRVKDSFRHIIPPKGDSPLYVRDILQTDRNTFWIATESGVLVYDRSKDKQEWLTHQSDHPWSLSDNAVYTISQDHQGGLWIGTYFGGINYYHPRHNIFQKIFPRFSTPSIQGHAVREFVQDTNQSIWIGTEDNGLYKWDMRSNQFTGLTPGEGLSQTNIHGLAVCGDSLLVGTFYGGLDVIDTRKNRMMRHFDSHNTHGQLASNFIFHIFKTRKGRVLLATIRGLYEFFPGRDEFVLVKDVPGHIFYTSIYEDRSENLWVATWRNGLYVVDYAQNKTTAYKHVPSDSLSLNSNRVNRIFQDSYGNIWIATESGLAQWTATGKPIRRISKRDGLPSNVILAMQEDAHKNLWVSTTRGLVKLHLDDLKMHIFNKESGLLDLQFNYNSAFKDASGYFYFGSSSGFIRFHPDSVDAQLSQDVRSPLFITRFQSLQRDFPLHIDAGTADTSITYSREVRLQYDESTIRIDFAALNYVSSQSTSYLYLLEGFDKDWTLLRNTHTAHYTKIPPGDYVFRVKAVDTNGEKISEERALRITVRPPIWASPAAYATYTVLAGLMVFGLAFLYDKRVKEKNRGRLEAIKTHRERELFKTKMDFFARIAHDIKTPLTLIKAPLERLRSLPQADLKTERLLTTMHRNTEKLVDLTNQLLDFRKIESNEYNLHLENHDVNRLLSERLMEFQHVFNQRGLSFKYQCDEQISAYLDIEIVTKILDNLITNAIKYADSKVIVTLDRSPDEKSLRFTIKNDGRQPSRGEMEQIFKPFYRTSEHQQIEGSGLGLALAHSFAELHGGTLKFLDNSENLNIFVLEIPIYGTYG
ncbi:two-component regulator propeller domain-containing protein [Sphingobacterium suaedae]